MNTVYMIPLTAMNDQESFEDLNAASAPVNHVDVSFNPGHPGLLEPHYHVVLWHVTPAKAASLK